ncbi:MAG: redoxin domain-containing protein [Solirubrobacteraceae bacterium]
MRAPVDHIFAPAFPGRLPWINSVALRMDQQIGRPVLIEFWDFCRPNSIRTLPYLRAWHERYEPDGLRLIGVHCSGFEPSADPDTVAAAVRRLDLTYPVVVDVEYEVWGLFGNLGWPARYLFDQQGRLFDYHYGEGAYDETELAIQELLDVRRDLLAPLRAEDRRGAALRPQSEDVPGPYSGPYEAGGVWAVLEGAGTASVNGRPVRVAHPGAYELVTHTHSTAGTLELEIGDGVRCHAVCFTPGLVDPRRPAD